MKRGIVSMPIQNAFGRIEERQGVLIDNVGELITKVSVLQIGLHDLRKRIEILEDDKKQ